MRTRDRTVLPAVGRLAALASGVVLVAVAGAWLASVGVAGLTWILAWGGGIALGVVVTGRWRANRTAVWLAAMVFGATVSLPAVALGRDVVLTSHGQRVEATVAGYRHSSGVHSSSSYTELVTHDGRYLEVSGSIRPDTDGPVTVLVDPAATVAPQLASDVTVGSDLAWSVAGLTLVLAVVLGYGISAVRVEVCERAAGNTVDPAQLTGR